MQNTKRIASCKESAKDPYIGSKLICIYAKLGVIEKSQQVFNELPFVDVASWNALIAGYTQQDRSYEALCCFKRMQSEGFSPDQITFTCILKACGKVRDLEDGKRIHSEINRSGFLEKDIALGNALIDMYAKCSALANAQQVFEELPVRDVVSWSTIIGGNNHLRRGLEALHYFEEMHVEGLIPNAVTFICILKTCAGTGVIDLGKQIHDDIVRRGLLKKDISLGTALVDMYAKCGMLAQAQQVLQELPSRDIICWNALTAGYLQHGQCQEALNCLLQMQSDGLCPDAVTFIYILKTCGSIGDINMAEEVHKVILNGNLLKKNTVLGNALVHMYANCGQLVKARKVHDELPLQHVASWNTLIAGYIQQEEGHDALDCWKRMIIQGLFADSITYISVLKACGIVGDVVIGKEIHAQVIGRGLLKRDIALGNALISMYAKCGLLSTAEQVQEELSVRTVVSWSVLMASYVEDRQYHKVLNCFECMKREGIRPDVFSFICILKACASLRYVEKGKEIHEEIVSQYALLERDVVLGNSLMDMYAKCGLLMKAQGVLEDLPTRNTVSWNVLIASCVEQGKIDYALKCLEWMECEGFSPNVITFICSLNACGGSRNLDKGKEIHKRILREGLMEENIMLGTALVDMYAKCGLLENAHQVLEGLTVRNAISWSALIAGYAQEERGYEALNCFEQMQNEGFSPDAITFTCILKACSSIGAIDKGEKAHESFMSSGLLQKDVILGNALVDMYAKCGLFVKARHVLEEEISARDIVSWTALAAGYTQQGHGYEALYCSERMHCEGFSSNAMMFVCILKACAIIRDIDKGKAIHREIERMGMLGRDIVLGGALVDLYAKCGLLEEAYQVHEGLLVRNAVSWNSLIGGFSEQGQGHKAMNCFEQMQSEGLCPDVVTYTCILKACGGIGAVDIGKRIHEDICYRGFLLKDVVIGNALVYMYAKCGLLAKAAQVAEELPMQNIVSWNSLLTGYAQHGRGYDALDCFSHMQMKDLFPDEVTFLCVLSACSHSGLLLEAQLFYEFMNIIYGIMPNIQHQACMILCFARTGQFEEVMSMMKVMPNDCLASRLALLGACEKWGNVKLAKFVFDQAVQLDNNCAAAYVLMASVFAAAGLQEDAKKIETMSSQHQGNSANNKN